MTAREELREAIGTALTMRRTKLAAPSCWHELIDAIVALPEVQSLLSAAERAERAEAALARSVADGESLAFDLETLRATIEEELPTYALDDGTCDDASPIETVEYVAKELAETRARAERAEAETERLRADLVVLPGNATGRLAPSDAWATAARRTAEMAIERSPTAICMVSPAGLLRLLGERDAARAELQAERERLTEAMALLADVGDGDGPGFDGSWFRRRDAILQQKAMR